MAKKYANLTAKQYATGSIRQGTIKGINSALAESFQTLGNSLEATNLSNEAKQSVRRIFFQIFRGITNALDTNHGLLRNTYRRSEYYWKNLNLVEPIEIEFPTEPKKKSTFQYVPVLETLKSLFNNDVVPNYCMNREPSEEGNGFFDIRDGTIIKEFFFMAKLLK